MPNDDDLLQEFMEEAADHLSRVERDLLEIEAQGDALDLELVNQVFRGIHSIKGAAGFLGLKTVESLAHRLENLLNGIRNGDFRPDEATTNVLLAASDRLRALIEIPEESEGADITSHLEALDRVAERHLAARQDDLPCTDDPMAVDPMAVPSETSEGIPADEGHAGAVLPPASAETDDGKAAVPGSSTEASTRGAARNGSTGDMNVRVAVSTLDELMNLAGELVLSRNQLLQNVGESTQSGFEAVASRIDQVTSELQEAIMQTRMQPIGTVFNRFPRVVRDLSAKLGKRCDLSTSGENVELDKTIIEAIVDPLTHLVRNAIDHGIESVGERTARGKRATGSLHLRAFHRAGKVLIGIEDDGRGIDPERLKQKAVAKGLLTPERAAEMSDREAVRLIFHPGFSTAEKVTDVSGRGVGMDVVRTNIEQLGGSVDVETELGTGTKVTVVLPLTLAIIPCLLVRAGDERYAIPQASIAELVRISAAEIPNRIGRVKNAEVLRLRGSLLPLVRLSEMVEARAAGTPSGNEADAAGIAARAASQQRAWNIIVVEAGRLRYGIVVDGLYDSEEIVVKPLGRHLKDCHCLAGATVLGDGRVAMILDIPGIATHAGLDRTEEEPQEEDRDECLPTSDDEQWVLLFTNDPQERFAIPMGLISRIERIRADQIDHVAGQELLQYRGGSLPLLSLEHCIKARPRPDQPRLYVAVFNMGAREAGLIVPDILDIQRVSGEIDSLTLCERGVMGSLVVDGKTVRMIDLFKLAEAKHPEWVTARPPRDEQAGTATILLAEDSDFFRKHVAGYLEEEGYRIVPCEDGAIAWQRLATDASDIDLVITDVQMPNLDGLQLCRKIKQTTGTAHLPVIALTSLAGEEDVRRGQECGVDEYQVKMDRDNLLRAVERLLAAAGSGHGGAAAEAIIHYEESSSLV